MPLDFQEIEIQLGGGPNEKVGDLFRTPGKLRHAINVDTRQVGILRKRRGYQRVDIARVVNESEDSEDVFHALSSLRRELVIIGHDYLYALSSLDGDLTGGHTSATVTRRGPTIRGAFAIQHVTSSSLGSTT